MPKDSFIIIYSTFPKRRLARRLAKKLIKEKLIACANIFKIDSVFSWKNDIEEAREYGVIFKTQKSLYKKVEERIKEEHRYEVPAIISFDITAGSNEFLSWIKNETMS